MARNDQMTRLFFLIHTLESAPHGLTPKDLLSRATSRGFNVTERTIYRDLEALESVFPFEHEIDQESSAKRWILGKHARISNHFILTSRELFALFLAKGALEPLSQTPFYQDMQNLFNKFEGQLEEKSEPSPDKKVVFHVGPKWGEGVDLNILEPIRTGCAERRILEIEYCSANSGLKTVRKVGPQFLYFSKGALYLLADDVEDNKLKTFALPRFQAVRITDESYSGAQVEPDSYFSNSFGAYHGTEATHVVLQFTQAVGAFVRERQYHPSQKVLPAEKGVQLEFKIAITPDFIQWILSFGHDCTVIKPAELKQELKDRAEKILKMYRAAG